MRPATTVPTICPPLVIELRSPSPRDRSPGSCEPSDQVAGQNIARDTMTQSCATKRAAYVDANANTMPAARNIAAENIASRLPPRRSVHAPPSRLKPICTSTGSETRLPIATPEKPRWSA